VDEDDLLTRVQRVARLHGRNESRRVVCGVLQALGDVLPGRAMDLLLGQLPADIADRLRRRDRHATPADCRAFLHRVATILYVEQPENAFLARVVLEQLNTTLRVITPAGFSHLVAADLRPLLGSGRPTPDRGEPVRSAATATVPVEQLAGLLPVPSAPATRTTRKVAAFESAGSGSTTPSATAARN
jgi:uncharacterized protein (DUF2267 family)